MVERSLYKKYIQSEKRSFVDLAEVVFDECTMYGDPTPGSDEFKVTLNFNLLDDIDIQTYAIPSDESKDMLKKWKRKTQHPLMLMV